ncbi:hypothetical protein [Chlorogloea sp. CCALA 695]|uniref:hypothetical protein n=1 Tax=Chlorogloea sp. CCALA 695 TaxID=2107693 RepID=UPI000D06A497|nr:hypothetical protein [Chlorogloea sp. CCALA 695]PSB28525.1 hypothetical protein C7B70_20805 [Chlorogloea sp. CCALA 695]
MLQKSSNQLLNFGSTFVSYNIATGCPLPPISSAIKEYWLAGNGVFLRAARDGIEVCVQLCALNIPGLPELKPYFNFDYPPIPQPLVSTMLELSIAAGQEEVLFYLAFTDGDWQLIIPDQIATKYSVTPKRPLDPFYESAIVEVHSHHQMAAEFSIADDKEESGKFRLFAVLGEIFTQPTISVRVGIYTHFQVLPACQVFELPPGIVDANRFVL